MFEIIWNCNRNLLCFCERMVSLTQTILASLVLHTAGVCLFYNSFCMETSFTQPPPLFCRVTSSSVVFLEHQPCYLRDSVFPGQAPGFTHTHACLLAKWKRCVVHTQQQQRISSEDSIPGSRNQRLQVVSSWQTPSDLIRIYTQQMQFWERKIIMKCLLRVLHDLMTMAYYSLTSITRS